jgi:hypothetical protein
MSRNSTKPLKRTKYVCQDNCEFIRPDNIGIPNGKIKFRKGITYIVVENSAVNTRYIYTNGNGPSSELMGSVDTEFVKRYFRLKVKDDEILQHVDLMFENIFFNHG